jgi:hypothetical protein
VYLSGRDPGVQRERNLRHKAIAGACLEPVEPFERKGCKQIEQRHCLKG